MSERRNHSRVIRSGRGWERRRGRVRVVVTTMVVLMAIVVSGGVAAQAPGPTLDQIASESRDVGAALALTEAYIHAYVQRDVPVLRTFWTGETELADAAFGALGVGVDSLVVQVPRGWAGVEVESLDVLSRFASLGGVTVTNMRLRGAVDLQSTVLHYEVPFTVILRLEDGRVVRHEDYPDYPCLNRQTLAQENGPLPYDLLPRCIG